MLKEYSSYFVAYLLDNLEEKEKNNIERIILFGSAARGEAEKESDIDIFIEVIKKTKKFEQEVERATERFYKSREAALFKVKGAENQFSIKIGKLDEWKDLERSIASTGIVLYGHYESKKIPSGMKHSIIIFWDKTEKNRGAFLNKVYGFKIRGKRYPGMIEKLNGRKLGKSCIMVPIEKREEILKIIKKYKVNAKITEVWA